MKKIEILDYFFDRNIDPEKLAAKLGVSIADFQAFAADPSGDLQAETQIERRIGRLYVRERIKDQFRRNPYLGAKKICERLELNEIEYQNAYETLQNLGELTYVIELPEWATQTEGKGVRCHSVK